MRLAKKIALVTGASRGIGHATSLLLAQEGATVVAAARTQKDLDELVALIASRGGTAKAVLCDATSSADVAACVGEVIKSYGRLDILINNVGIGGYWPFLDWSEAD